MAYRCGKCGKELKFGGSLCRPCYTANPQSRNARRDFTDEDSVKYLEGYKEYRKSFDWKQELRFRQLMMSRPSTVLNVSEAVDIVMREPRAGECCHKCQLLRKVNRRQEDVERGLQSSWQMIIRYLEYLLGDAID